MTIFVHISSGKSYSSFVIDQPTRKVEGHTAGNMHRCKVADALLSKMVTRSFGYDLIIISEQYKKKESGTWLEDSSSTAPIWLPPGSNVGTEGKGNGNGFVWVKCDLYTVISTSKLISAIDDHNPSSSSPKLQEKL
nr:uncharacterized protein LOC118682274 [Bactrocera oleae]